ncbi:MAG: hypothetical protein ACJ8J0_16670 [Longimicrobiaceae bacterium]
MRKKMRMRLEELQVESYPTTAAGPADGGTVHGHAASTLAACSGYATCLSACSATDGVHICKTCGPCC